MYMYHFDLCCKEVIKCGISGIARLDYQSISSMDFLALITSKEGGALVQEWVVSRVLAGVVVTPGLAGPEPRNLDWSG